MLLMMLIIGPNINTKLMNFRNTTIALTIAATSSAVKITSTNVFDDIGNAFDDAYNWTMKAGNDAEDWMEGAANDAYDWTVNAADDIADFAKDNKDVLIGTGATIATGGVIGLAGLAAGQAGLLAVE